MMLPSRENAPPLSDVLALHREEAASLYVLRTALVKASMTTLHALCRHDERLAAHLDGVRVGDRVEPAVEQGVPWTGSSMFLAAVEAVRGRNPEQLRALVSRCTSVDAQRSFVAALAWQPKAQLQGVVAALLGSNDPSSQRLAIAVCAAHGVDPGLVSRRHLQDGDPRTRARALRAAGELGLLDCLPTCMAGLNDENPEIQLWAAWSAVLLGNREKALDALIRARVAPGARSTRAFRLSLQAMELSDAHADLQRRARELNQVRALIEGSGIVGDPAYVPWLIGHMKNDSTARVAGEAFSLVTGADLDALQLWRPQPDDFESGPNENPEDENVEMDPDEGLMWPDAVKVQRWWNANSNRFQSGQRYFMGAPVTREHCIEVLKNGYQRQRILAAHYLCLLNPGTPLFNTSAPAWRQQKLLAQM